MAQKLINHYEGVNTMMTYELDDIEKRALLSAVVDRARADLNDGKPLTEMRREGGRKMIAHYVVKVFIDDDLTETQLRDAQCNFCGLREQVERVFRDHAEYDNLDIQVIDAMETKER